MTTYAFSLACAFLLTQPKNGLAHSTESVEVKGRAVDMAGKPIVGAEVQVWRKIQRDGKPTAENDRVTFDGRESLRTDGEGRFQSTATLELDQPLRVIAQADGMLAARSPWIKPGEKKVVELGDIVLRRLRTVTGRVVDRQGNPVPDATVFHAGDAHKSERTTTNSDGRFRLPGVPESRAFVFVEKTGHRFTGMLLGPSQEAAELILARADEQLEPLATSPPALGADQRVALARTVLQPFLDAACRSGADIDKNWAFYTLGHIDTLEALERIDRDAWSGKLKRDTRDQVIEMLIERQAAERLEEARPYIESSEAPESVADCYTTLARAIPIEDRASRLDCLKQALLHARNSKEPERLLLLARIAEHLFELGEKEQAKAIADQVRAVAERSSDQVLGWTLGPIGLALGQIDLPAALRLLERLSDHNYADRLGMLAIRLARQNPAEAERVWNLVGQREVEHKNVLSVRDWRAPRICYQMVPIDRERARRFTQNLYDPIWRTYSLGAMADALAATDREAAREMLLDVFSGAGPQDMPDYVIPDRKAIAVTWLLPIAEQIDPQLAREYFWRAISLRTPRPTVEWLDYEVEYWDAMLAKMIARYDPKIARAMIEPLLEPLSRARADEWEYLMHEALAAAAVADLRWAVELLDRMPDPPDASASRPKNVARIYIARLLGAQGKWYWQTAGYEDRHGMRYY